MYQHNTASMLPAMPALPRAAAYAFSLVLQTIGADLDADAMDNLCGRADVAVNNLRAHGFSAAADDIENWHALAV